MTTANHRKTAEGTTSMSFNKRNTSPSSPPPSGARRVYDVQEFANLQEQIGIKEKSGVEKNSAYSDVTLPSNFFFYPYKTLSVRFIRGAEQAKFARAAKDGRLRHVVDAMSATLEPNKSAYDLTMQDFHWLMYYQRRNANKKVPYVHKTFCEDDEHLKKVISKELDEKTLEISVVLSNSTLEEIIFNPEALVMPSFANRLPLGSVRMSDLVEVSEMDDKGDFEELAWLADRAAYIAPVKGCVSLLDRIKIVQQLSAEEMEEMEAYIASASNYGVNEYITVRCNGCGAEKTSQVVIDALSFLPSHR